MGRRPQFVGRRTRPANSAPRPAGQATGPAGQAAGPVGRNREFMGQRTGPLSEEHRRLSRPAHDPDQTARISHSHPRRSSSADRPRQPEKRHFSNPGGQLWGSCNIRPPIASQGRALGTNWRNHIEASRSGCAKPGGPAVGQLTRQSCCRIRMAPPVLFPSKILPPSILRELPAIPSGAYRHRPVA